MVANNFMHVMEEYFVSSGYVDLIKEIRDFTQKLTAKSNSPVEVREDTCGQTTALVFVYIKFSLQNWK